MATVDFMYKLPQHDPTSEWFDTLHTVKPRGKYEDVYYWMYPNSSDASDGTTILLQVSQSGEKYRCVWKTEQEVTFGKDFGLSPNPRWLNPETIIHRGKQPLPFSWRQ